MRAKDLYAAALAMTALLVGALAIGGATRWTAWTASLLALASCAPLVLSRRAPTRISPLLIFLGVATGLTLVQILPLPAFLVSILSPAKHALVTSNAAALGEDPPAFFALSYDPPATLLELAKLAGYLGIAATALRLAAGRQRAWLVRAVALVGGAVALASLGHELAGAKSVFGLYTPEHAKAPHVMGPLLNGNHLASLMVLCTCASAGLAIAESGRARALWIANLILCAAVSLLASSRAGVIGLLLGPALVVTLVLLQRRSPPGAIHKPAERSVQISQVVIGLCIVTLLAALTAKGVLSELSETDVTDEITEEESKVGLWRAALPLVGQNPWTGIGRGAFEVAIPRVRPTADLAYKALENEYLQAIVDWGLLGAAAAGVALIFLVLTTFRRWRRSPLEAGCIGGLVALGLQSAVDFGISMPGVAMPAVVLMAFLSYESLEKRRSRPHTSALALGLAAGAAALFLSALPLATPVRADSELQDGSLEEAMRAWKRHPADYHSAGVVAAKLLRAGDKRGLLVLGRALEANTGHYGLHLLAARTLRSSQNPSQALGEYAAALDTAPLTRLPELVDEVLAAYPETATAARALPRSPTRLEALARLLFVRKRNDVLLRYGQELAISYPQEPEVFVFLSRAATREGQTDAALTAARSAYGLEVSAENLSLLGEALILAQKPDEALQTLETARQDSRLRLTDHERARLLFLEGKILFLQDKNDEARAKHAQAIGGLGGFPREQAQVHRSLATIEEALGNRHQATLERRRAQELEAEAKSR